MKCLAFRNNVVRIAEWTIMFILKTFCIFNFSICQPKLLTLKFSVITGGNATFPNILNNFVHVCMYFYYMMSAMGPEYAKFLWWKKYMTELQIVSRI